VTPDPPGSRTPSAYRAVIFDLGGVVMPSPMESFRAYERRNGLPHRFISEIVVNGGEHGAWSRLERGELSLDEFADAFDAEAEAAGGRIVTRELLAELATGAGPHAPMVTAIRAIRDRGLRTAALTNNWRAPDDTGDPGALERRGGLDGLFDVVVESAIEGLRKPDVRIYELTLARLEVGPHEAVFLDDLGTNLKPARAMGMATIKVADVVAALDELEAVLGFELGHGGVASG
jgi:epoxide hydrolase-like predicted phosphatase